MATTTVLSDPSPTETFWAVIAPAVSPPSSCTWSVPPVPELKVTAVVPEPAMSFTVVEVPSRSMTPSVPVTAEPEARFRVAAAEPPVTWSDAVEPCWVVATERRPDIVTVAFNVPPDAWVSAWASCWAS